MISLIEENVPDAMPTDQIEWNIAVSTSSFNELSECWAELKKISQHLAAPEHAYTSSMVGAGDDLDKAQRMVNSAMRGLDNFLEIQGAYVKRITAPYMLKSVAEPFDVPKFEANSIQSNSSTSAPATISYTASNSVPTGNTSWSSSVHYHKLDSVKYEPFSDLPTPESYLIWVDSVYYQKRFATVSK